MFGELLNVGIGWVSMGGKIIVCLCEVIGFDLKIVELVFGRRCNLIVFFKRL